jgi:putative ABC transport system substrate-binding protein
MRMLFLVVVLAVGAVSSAISAEYKVMVIVWRGCEEACQGFQDYLTDAGLDVEFLVRDADRDASTLSGFVVEARAENVDLLLSWGTSVTRGTAGTLDTLDDPAFNHDIPHVFTVVADPIGARIIESFETTGRPNVTGTFNRVPEAVNIETIRTYRPNFHHLGLLFNRNENNSVLKLEEMIALSDIMGFELTALELPLAEDGAPVVEDIALGVATLKAAGVDFIYLGSSSFLDINADIFTGSALEHGLPVLSPYERLVTSSQALISVAARYYDTGRLAGELAEKILVDGVRPGDLPVARMTDFAFVINLDVARKLDMYPPIELLQIAETVE